METRTSKWVWSSILYRWPTLWCSWAPIFSVSSLCLGRKDTFFHFRPTEVHKFGCSHLFKTYFTLNVPRDLLAVVTSCTFSHVSYMFRGQNENFNCVLSFWTFFTSFLQYYSRAASGKVVRSKWSVPVRMACVLSLGLSHHRAGNRWQQISFSYYWNKGRHSVRNNQPHPNAHLKGKREVGLSVFNWFSILKVVIWNSLFY